jgi:hypothetical protein
MTASFSSLCSQSFNATPSFNDREAVSRIESHQTSFPDIIFDPLQWYVGEYWRTKFLDRKINSPFTGWVHTTT